MSQLTTIEDAMFDLSIKKSKSTSKLNKPKQKVEEEELQFQLEDDEVVEGNDGIVSEEIDFGKKKRAKKPTKKIVAEQPQPQENAVDSLQSDDRDYTYEELACRVYDLIHQSNPSFSAKGVKKIPPPIVGRGGSKITMWTNFIEICEALSRKPDHLLSFVLAELGTDGSLDGSARFVIKGRFQAKGVENVLRRYIVEYVACLTCNSPSTQLKKENRLQFLCCDKCGSKRSVTVVKKGFEALIGKRSKIEV